jgi:hypothetical protein
VLYQITDLGLALLRGGLAASGVDTSSGVSAS